MLGSAFVIALRQLRRNVLRSILTVLGIVIGVAAVIAMVTLGSGATLKVTSDISSLGRNMLIIQRGTEPSGGGISITAPAFTDADIRALQTEIATISAVAPTSNQRSLAVNGNINWATSVIGTTNDYFVVRDWVVSEGRAFTSAEDKSGRMLCVLGATTRKELFGNQSPIGNSIRLGRQSCEVIGVLSSKGQSTFGSDQDDLVIVPLKAFHRRIAGKPDIDTIYLSATSAAVTTEAKSAIISLLRERRRLPRAAEDDFFVRDLKEITEVVERTTGIMTAFLSAVAAVSLLVGGIGIMNIMLVSVTERTREIGIRLAIGAQGSDILRQFLIEAVVVSSIGGVIGMALGLLGAVGAAKALNVPFVFEPGVVVLAFVFSSLVGICFGYFPARRAAKMDPIQALRYE